MTIPAHEMGDREVVFHHVDADTGRNTVLAIGRMLEWCKAQKLEVHRIPVDPAFVSFCFQNRGIEPHRLARLTAAQCKEPLIFCRWYDDTFLLADGHHRYVRISLDGGRWCNGWILTPEQWEPFVVDGADEATPQILQTMFSGIV